MSLSFKIHKINYIKNHALFLDQQLTTIESKAFINATGIHNMDLSNNNLTKLFTSMFNGARNCLKLNLENNKIDTINQDAFRGLISLQHLHLSGEVGLLKQMCCM